MPPKRKNKSKGKVKVKKQLTKDEMQLIVLFSIVFVALFVGSWVVLISPAKEDLSKKKSKLSKLRADLMKSRKTAKELPNLKKDIEKIKLDISKQEDSLVPTAEFDFFRDTIRDMGAEYDVKVISDRTREAADANKSVFKENLNYSEMSMNLNLKSGYHNLGGFISRIENTSPYRKVDSFSITPKSGRKGRRNNRRRSNKKKEETIVSLSANLTVLSLMKAEIK